MSSEAARPLINWMERFEGKRPKRETDKGVFYPFEALDKKVSESEVEKQRDRKKLRV